MKYVGFIKEHDKTIDNAIPYNEITHLPNPPKGIIKKVRQYLEIKKVIRYLKKGVMLTGATGSVESLENNGEEIASWGFYTDGEWIWPEYFVYYLKKYPNFPIDKDFMNYLSDKNFTFKASDDLPTLLGKYELDFLQKLTGK
jgi:hypothetical protein